MKSPADLTTTITAVLLLMLLPPGSPAVRAETQVHQGTVYFAEDGPLDLDLTGKMVRAVNFSNTAPALPVNGLSFVPHGASPGLAVSTPSFIVDQGTRTGGASALDDRNLDTILSTALTGSAAGVSVSMPVTAGKPYVLQLVFYGNKQEDRRWDVEVEGALVLDEITSLGVVEGSGRLDVAEGVYLIYRYPFTAGDSTLTVRMGSLGGGNDGGLREPLLQALTLEETVTDADSDGLPDAWELATFGSLAVSDPWSDDDNDGLECFVEYNLGTDPREASGYDTDDDSLSDGDEYRNVFTDPLVSDTDGDGLRDGYEDSNFLNPLHPDTDGDGLSDGDELLLHGSDPLLRDSDEDGFSDDVEVAAGTGAEDAFSHPLLFTRSTAFTGAGIDEGLDFRGIFTAAVSFGSPGLSGDWRVENARFRPWHQVAGLTSGATRFADGWVGPVFSSTAGTHSIHLARAVESIQYDPVMNIAVPGLVAGRHYKLQLLFAEGCCQGRGFDVFVEGTQIADEFAVMALQGGTPTPAPVRGAALVHGFLAGDTVLNIRLDTTGITTPSLNDPNAILNALTVEEVIPGTDTDGDGQPDAWERHFFGGLEQNFGGDPDGDGLFNLTEFRQRTDPTVPDTDGDGLGDLQEFNYSLDPLSRDTDVDGLTDGEEVYTWQTLANDPDSDDDGLTDSAEVHVYHTEPLLSDSDHDTLTDGLEALTMLSNPLALDTDGDGYSDPTEYHSGTNPADANHGPGATHVATVFGPGPAGGLDLTGQFRYAVNIGENTGPQPVLNAVFTSLASTPGVTVTGVADVADWTAPAFGTDPASKALAKVFASMRWRDALATAVPADRQLRVTMQGLTAGVTYRLQLLFSENYGPRRYFNITVNGVQIACRFNIATVQGGAGHGAAVIHRFTAAGPVAEVVLDLPYADMNHGEDPNPLLCGFTLEQLPAVPAFGITGVQTVPAGLRLTVTGAPGRPYALDHSTDLHTWSVIGFNLGFPGPGPVILNDYDPARTGPQSQRGFYRLRDVLHDPFPN